MKAPPSRGTLPLLVEIGCEEIPARFLSEAQRNFGERLEAAFREARLLPVGAIPRHGGTGHETRPDGSGSPLQLYSTPRRLVAYVPAVLEQQPDTTQQVLGPPAKVAFDAAGKPTRAAESFAEKQAARVKDLIRVNTAKGEYLAFKKTTRGQRAEVLLRVLLPAVVTRLSFPKSMYWVAKAGPRFVRPIRWVLAMLGEGKQARAIPLEIAGVKAGLSTYGHRAWGGRPMGVRSFGEYTKKLRAAGVEFDSDKRRKRIREESKVLLEKFKMRVIEDAELENWLVSSTEWPCALGGEFDPRYLHLAREILIAVMRDHQKYFAVEDRKGNLQPRFVAITNLERDSKGFVRAGHERVLAARFRDAEFFWQADQRVALDRRQELLAGVTYQAELGSYAEKIRRMKAIAQDLCAALEAAGDFREVDRDWTLRAIDLSKCDLTTQMVREFPELQGVVGGLYAQAQHEAGEVARAIYDHYLPKGLEDRLPRERYGAVVSLADKIDSVVAGFAVGHEPTGSSDPFALRRQANGAIKVLVELSLPVRLKETVEHALSALNIEWRRPQAEVFRDILDFFTERLRYYLESVRKLRYDTVRAVLAAGWDVPAEALGRAEALERVRGGENFEALSLAAKRIKNILAKSATASDWQPGEVDRAMLKEQAEQELFEAYLGIHQEVGALRESGKNREALERIASLRPQVDRFFDKVLVMCEDAALRQNRLRLVGKLDELFSGIAQFAEIVAAPANVDASTSKKQGQGTRGEKIGSRE